MKQQLLFKSLLLLAALLMIGTKMQAQEAYAVLSEDGLTVTFYYDTQKDIRGGIIINENSISTNSSSPYGTANTAVINASFADYYPTSTAHWFEDCKNLKSIEGILYIKTDNATDMNNMFKNCSRLTSLDLSSFKTENVIDMHWMFYQCTNLISLDVSGFKTDNVTNMAHMFSSCWNLTSLDVSGFKTDNVTSMFGMFYGCERLKEIDVSGFKTDNVTVMGGMFRGCGGLTSINVSGFNTENVTNMNSMFHGCTSLTSLDVSSFKTNNVEFISSMFKSCTNLISIFANEGWNTEKVKIGDEIFKYCDNLVGGQGTAYDASHTDYTYARIDGGPEAPGYFTYKASTDINAIMYDNTKETPIYNLSGQRITSPQKGINIINGKKVMMK